MARAITPFLMFDGVAQEAMDFYVGLFKGSAIRNVVLYGPGEPGREGSIKVADFVLGDQRFRCIDSPVKHPFGFTPSLSIFVDCDDEAELDETFKQLSAGGKILMPLGNYGFSKKFGWLNDRFGVSWQLNLP